MENFFQYSLLVLVAVAVGALLTHYFNAAAVSAANSRAEMANDSADLKIQRGLASATAELEKLRKDAADDADNKEKLGKIVEAAKAFVEENPDDRELELVVSILGPKPAKRQRGVKKGDGDEAE